MVLSRRMTESSNLYVFLKDPTQVVSADKSIYKHIWLKTRKVCLLTCMFMNPIFWLKVSRKFLDPRNLLSMLLVTVKTLLELFQILWMSLTCGRKFFLRSTDIIKPICSHQSTKHQKWLFHWIHWHYSSKVYFFRQTEQMQSPQFV